MANRPCNVVTPVLLLSWGNIAQACLLSDDSPYDWPLEKGDDGGAYKKRPLLLWGDSVEVITATCTGGRWYG